MIYADTNTEFFKLSNHWYLKKMMRVWIKINALITKSFLIIIGLIMACTVAVAQCVPSSKNIFIIHSYHAQYPWVKSYMKGMLSVMNNQFDIEHFYMDTKRLPSNRFPIMAAEAFKQFLSVKPAGVILSDDNALKWATPMFKESNCPIVYLGINNNPRNYNLLGHKNISGVLERPPLKRSMLLMKKHLVPMKRAMLLFDSGTTASVLKEEIFNNKSSVTLGNTVVDIYLIDTFGQWKETFTSQSKTQIYDVIYIGLYHTLTDSKGNHVDSEKVIRWTSKNSKLPIFSLWNFSVGKGRAMGGYVLNGEDQGVRAAERMLEMFSKPPELILPPVTGEEGRYIFSRHELKRWSLTLPKPLEEHTQWVP